MKLSKITTGILIIVLIMTISVGAVEWKNKFGVGLRGPVFAPLIKGSDYGNFGTTHEHLMMGWNLGLDLKYG